jgi:hypothetical protein
MYFCIGIKNIKSKDMKESWQDKAVARRLENKELKKWLKEKENSRDAWKAKYMKERVEKERYKKELEAIKKKLEQLLK